MELDFEQPIRDLESQLAELLKAADEPTDKAERDKKIANLRNLIAAAERQIYEKLTPWQTVQVARHPARPGFRDYVACLCSEFVELHGDRCFGDDPSLVGGFASIGDLRVMLIGTDKGKTVEDKVRCNFGMPNPEGYRKALRLMKLAEKYHLPIVSLVDTPAAYPGKEAEERGQAEAIARNLAVMARIEVPFLVVITGEGGSGGALAIAVGDVVLMLKYAIYSVIPPEGCAAILWRDSTKAPEAAEALKITAESLKKLRLIDGIIPEPPGGAHRHPEQTAAYLKEAILRHLKKLRRSSVSALLERRFDKYVRMGKFDDRRFAAH